MQVKRATVYRGSLFYIPSTSSGATFNLWHVGRLFHPSESNSNNVENTLLTQSRLYRTL